MTITNETLAPQEPTNKVLTLDEWLAALKSGEYKKGSGQLWHEDYNGEYEDYDTLRYCCLGVYADACDLDRYDGSDGFLAESDDHFLQSTYGYTIAPWLRVWVEEGIGQTTTLHVPSVELEQRIMNDRRNFWASTRWFTIQEKLAAINDKAETFDDVIEWVETNLVPFARQQGWK